MHDQQLLRPERRPLAALLAVVAALALFVLVSWRGLPGTAVAIPTGQPHPAEQVVLCPGGLVPFTLVGDPKATPAVWGVGPDGSHWDLTWPAGFSARFDPFGLQILDPSGAVVARAGLVTGAGGNADPVATTQTISICHIGGNDY